MRYLMTLKEEVILESKECCTCGVVFAMTDELTRRRKADGAKFYCPNGHNMYYGPSEADRLREKLAEQTRTATKMAERARAAELAEQKMADEMKRLAKRASAGVCPCCNRTFLQLGRHMKTKHPEYGAQNSSDDLTSQ